MSQVSLIERQDYALLVAADKAAEIRGTPGRVSLALLHSIARLIDQDDPDSTIESLERRAMITIDGGNCVLEEAPSFIEEDQLTGNAPRHQPTAEELWLLVANEQSGEVARPRVEAASPVVEEEEQRPRRRKTDPGLPLAELVRRTDGAFAKRCDAVVGITRDHWLRILADLIQANNANQCSIPEEVWMVLTETTPICCELAVAGLIAKDRRGWSVTIMGRGILRRHEGIRSDLTFEQIGQLFSRYGYGLAGQAPLPEPTIEPLPAPIKFTAENPKPILAPLPKAKPVPVAEPEPELETEPLAAQPEVPVTQLDTELSGEALSDYDDATEAEVVPLRPKPPPLTVIEGQGDENVPRFMRDEALKWIGVMRRRKTRKITRIRFCTYAELIADHIYVEDRSGGSYITAGLSKAVFEWTYPNNCNPTPLRCILRDVGLFEDRHVFGEKGNRWKVTALGRAMVQAAGIMSTIDCLDADNMIARYGEP